MEHFTKAAAIDPTNHVFYSNRSAAYAGLGAFDNALLDAERTVSYKPDWPKGFSRKGAALYGLKRFNDAIEAYEAGIAIDPTSEARTADARMTAAWFGSNAKKKVDALDFALELADA